MRLAVSDAHAGLVAAVSRVLPGCSWQRCLTHLQRDIRGHVHSLAGQALAADLVRACAGQADADVARAAWDLAAPRVRALSRAAGDVFGLATLMWTVPGGAQETGGPYMRDPRHPRHFTDEFKRQIVDLYNAGKPKREIMDEYDLGKSTVERWIKSINATGSPRAADNRTPEQNRILELERENRRLRMEVDVLKQAALIYARK